MTTAAAMPSNQHEDDKHQIRHALEMEQSGEAERQKRGNHKHDEGKDVGEQEIPPGNEKH